MFFYFFRLGYFWAIEFFFFYQSFGEFIWVALGTGYRCGGWRGCCWCDVCRRVLALESWGAGRGDRNSLLWARCATCTHLIGWYASLGCDWERLRVRRAEEYVVFCCRKENSQNLIKKIENSQNHFFVFSFLKKKIIVKASLLKNKPTIELAKLLCYALISLIKYLNI